jgi:hypothetical protein
MDDNPGRNDWVIGAIDVQFGNGREEPYSFSCSVNFDTGVLRSSEIQPLNEFRGGPRSGPVPTAGIDACRRSVTGRLGRDGFDRVNIRSINAVDRPGGADSVTGIAEAEGRNGRIETFDFSCQVQLESSDVRALDVTRR